MSFGSAGRLDRVLAGDRVAGVRPSVGVVVNQQVLLASQVCWRVRVHDAESVRDDTSHICVHPDAVPDGCADGTKYDRAAGVAGNCEGDCERSGSCRNVLEYC